jgi:hypothetical protein
MKILRGHFSPTDKIYLFKHQYIYKNAGTYKAVFVYTNSYLGVSQQVKQDFTIQVK